MKTLKDLKSTSANLISRRPNLSRKQLVVGVALVAVIGISVKLFLFASAASFGVELENAALTGNANVISLTGASGGKAIRFGSSTATPTPTPAPTPTPVATGAIKTVFVVNVENRTWTGVKGNLTEWPYLNKTLLPQAAWADNFNTHLHPSLPNYIAMESASDQGWNGNGWNMPGNPSLPTTAHLTNQLNAAGIDWRYYGENIPGNGVGCPTTDPGKPYSMDHNPFPYFDDVRANTAYCQKHERPYEELAADLANSTTARYNFIVPNDYDQGEHIAPGSTCGACQSDTFLSKIVPQIMNSAAYKNGGALFVQFDEADEGVDGPSGMMVLSPLAKKNYSNSIAYQGWGSYVRTMEDIFQVKPYINTAATAQNFSDLFSTNF